MQPNNRATRSSDGEIADADDGGSKTMGDTPSPVTRARNRSQFFPWLLLLLITGTALILLFAHAPPRVRLLGLFAIAFGLLIGLLSRRFAELTGLRSRGLVRSATFCAIVLGQIGITVESHRTETSTRNRSENGQGNGAVAAALLQRAEPPADAKARELHEQMMAAIREQNSFSSYLARRVRPLAAWYSPWPELFWGVEILAAAVCGTFVAGRRRSSSSAIIGRSVEASEQSGTTG